jgi:sporulation protein YlmC with PRC-barrel domain
VTRKVYRWVFVLLLASVLALAGCEELENNGEPAGLDGRGSGEQIFGSQEGRPGQGNQGGEILPDTGSEPGRDDDMDGDRRDDDMDEGRRDDDMDEGRRDDDMDGDRRDEEMNEDRRDDSPRLDDLDRNDLYYSRDLAGYPIQTRDGDGLGHVRSLLIHPESGQIHYLLLEVDDDLNPNGRYVLVPWTAMAAETYIDPDDVDDGIPPGQLPPPDQRMPMDCSQIPPGHLPPPEDRDELCLDDDEDGRHEPFRYRFDRDTLAGGPAFSDLDALDAGGWEDEASQYWRGHIDDLPAVDEEVRRRGYIRVEDRDYPLLDRNGDRVGEVSGLLFHLPSRQASYAVLRGADLSDTREGYRVLPFSDLDWMEREDAFVLPLDRSELDRLPYYEDEAHLPVSPLRR